MTLPVYLASPEILSETRTGTTVRLEGPEARHAVTVRRTGPGERLRLTDAAGRLVTGTVRRVGPSLLELDVDQVHDEPTPDQRLVLVQALAKHDRDQQAVEAATEIGADEIVPWQAARSIVQWRGDRAARARRRWDSAILAATTQSRRARRPGLGATVTTAQLAGRVSSAAAAYVLHEEATTPLATCTPATRGDIMVVVGPEGGITAEELSALEAAGAAAVRLGPTVLRASSAGPAALAVICATGRWR